MTDTPAVPIPLNLADASAFLAASGLRLTEVTGHSVTGTLELGPQHHTPWGIVHGGVYTTEIESAATAGRMYFRMVTSSKTRLPQFRRLDTAQPS